MNGATNTTGPGSRRDFAKKFFAGVISALLGVPPLFAGLMVLFDPLRRKSSDSGAVHVTSLDGLPADDIPRKFPIVATRIDAWNTFTQVPVGAVYLRRTTDGQVHALNVVCPHAGCFVDYVPKDGRYSCPCHNSKFSVAGKIDDPSSPAPRGLDSLEVQVRDGKEIWVKFLNFQAGRAEKVPVA